MADGAAGGRGEARGLLVPGAVGAAGIAGATGAVYTVAPRRR